MDRRLVPAAVLVGRGPGPLPPVAERSMLARGRLVERLRERWFSPVTVVSAPAGYGKTTLLAQAVAANAAAPMGVDCWLTCGPDTTAASSLGEALCQAVGAPPGASSRAGAAGLAGSVVDAMWRRSPQPVALILDDVHEIPAGSEAARLLDAVVALLPANGHVVLATRGTPPVHLARLEVERRVVQLGQADLAFTEAEIAQFAALRGAPDARVAASGGWPALAELFASARSSTVGDYVGEEVLSCLTPAKRRHLGLLAHLGSFDDSLARAVLGPDVDVADLVVGLPLVSLVGESEWRLHSLWQSLLARDVAPAEIADVRRRAGVALLGRGRVGAAVGLLVDAEAWDEFTSAIAAALGVARPPVARDVLAGWLARLPVEVRDQPAGRLLAGVLAIESDTDRARELLEDCEAAFRALGQTSGELACLVQLGQMAWWDEDPEALMVVAARSFELEAAGCAEIEPLACLARALLFDIDNDSRSMLAELDRILPGSLNDAWSGIVSWARAIGLLELGHTPEALTAAERALDHAELLHAPLAQTTRLQALWFQGRATEVLEAFPAVLQLVDRSGYRNHTALVAAQCSVVHALRGQTDQAAGYLAQARVAAALVADAPLVDTNVSTAEAAVALVRGDEEAAPQQRHLALFYVLVPATRPVWDGSDLGPAWAFGRGLARAIVAHRQGKDLPPETPPLGDAAMVQAHLPPHWVAELAVAAVAGGREDGWHLLDKTWPVTRASVVKLARQTDGPLTRAARDAIGRLPAPPTNRLELRLLGPVELRAGDVPVDAPDWRRQRVRSLLAHLALHRTVNRPQLAGDLWPELDAEAQSRNLRVTLSYLLRVLEPSRGQRDASFFVRQHGNNVSLNPGGWLTVDLWDFDARCAQARDADRQGAPAEALDHGLRAVELWRDEPTDLASEPWAIAPLEQLRLRFAAVATRTGDLLLARGDTDRALALAERALTVDPWSEATHRLVVATHLARRDRLAARRALHRYRDEIGELGLDRDETTLMVERLLDSLPPELGQSSIGRPRDAESPLATGPSRTVRRR
jgi:LuxR family maltose regulon positive regulatory protein